MRILILNWRDIKHEWAGGSEVYLFELAKRWVKMGHKVTLFCGQDVYEKLPDEETINGIKVIRRGGSYSLYFYAFWLYITRLRHESDVVIDVQNGIPFFSVFYSRKPKVGVVYHVHGKQFFVELPGFLSVVGYLVEKYIFPLFYKRTKVIAISDTTKKDLVELGFKKKNISIVYCGIDGKSIAGRVRKFTVPTIIYLGRIKKYKRVDMLVKIMPQVLKKIPNAHLLVAGWGTEAGAVIDMSMRSVTRRRVKIIGPISEREKRYLLGRSWVFVNPSIGEGWGISVIEANLHGTPAISFKVAGLSESIQHEKTGILVKNEKELVERICEVLSNKRMRNKLSQNAVSWAKKFNWDKSSQDAFAIISDVYKKRYKR